MESVTLEAASGTVYYTIMNYLIQNHHITSFATSSVLGDYILVHRQFCQV